MALAVVGAGDISCEEEVYGEWGRIRHNLYENDIAQTGGGGASNLEAHD